MGGYAKTDPWSVNETDLTDGNATLIQTHAIAASKILQLEVNVNLYKTSDGSAVAAFTELVSFKNVAGTVTQINTQPARAQRIRSKKAYAISYDVATANTVKIKITGENGLHVKSRVKRI